LEDSLRRAKTNYTPSKGFVNFGRVSDRTEHAEKMADCAVACADERTVLSFSARLYYGVMSCHAIRYGIDAETTRGIGSLLMA
jgi:hypothetical protein